MIEGPTSSYKYALWDVFQCQDMIEVLGREGLCTTVDLWLSAHMHAIAIHDCIECHTDTTVATPTVLYNGVLPCLLQRIRESVK